MPPFVFIEAPKKRIFERILLWSRSQPFCYGFVVGGTENSEIEGTCVGAYPCYVLQVCIVGLQFFRIYIFEGDVLVVSESHVTVEGCLVMLHGAKLPILQQQGDEEVHELEQRL